VASAPVGGYWFWEPSDAPDCEEAVRKKAHRQQQPLTLPRPASGNVPRRHRQSSGPKNPVATADSPLRLRSGLAARTSPQRRAEAAKKRFSFYAFHSDMVNEPDPMELYGRVWLVTPDHQHDLTSSLSTYKAHDLHEADSAMGLPGKYPKLIDKPAKVDRRTTKAHEEQKQADPEKSKLTTRKAGRLWKSNLSCLKTTTL